MKKFLLLLFVFAGTASFALDRNAFTFTNYDLTLRLEPGQFRLGVRGKITLRNDSAVPQKTLALQISSSLAWRSIQANGQSLDFVSQRYTSDIDHTGSLSEAIVTLQKDVPAKGTLELEIGYEGIIPIDATRLVRMGAPKDLASHSDWDQIGSKATAVRGVGYVAWYPVAIEAANLSEGNSVFDALRSWKLRSASSSMHISLCAYSNHDDNLLAAFMNDVPGKGSTNGECSDHVFSPIGLTVPMFAAGKYSVAKGESGETRFFSDRPAAEIYQTASDRVVPFVTEWFGAPKRKVLVVELNDPKAAPFESGTMLLTPLNFNANTAESTAVHQLTHAALPSSRPWIYEGLAHFAQALYAEKRNGREAALELMNASRQQVIDREKAIAEELDANAASEQSLINTSSEEFVRSKAMYVWWMLRDMLGDPAIKGAIASYKADQDREPSYVQHLFAAQSKRDLEWFFDDWVYRDRGLPDFRIVSVYPRQTLQNTYLLTITVENLGEAGAEVPVMAPYQGIETTERLQVKGKSQNSVRLQMATVPDEATVNDGSVPETDFTNDTVKVQTPTK
ncbi:MAG TPA: hypothetical protein VH088_08910 [Terriglobales bacterium]|jgi:hypothetical protein|nr:hypothetical protein [Terriglobales bacterium]